MTVPEFPPRNGHGSRVQRLSHLLERRIVADEAWADLQLAASKFQKRPTPENHVAAHEARRRWEATWD